MAHVHKLGKRYRLQVRRKGFKRITAMFDTYEEAVTFGKKCEEKMGFQDREDKLQAILEGIKRL